MSLFSALSGVMYRIQSGSHESSIAFDNNGITAASVLPLPVGAISRRLSPASNCFCDAA